MVSRWCHDPATRVPRVPPGCHLVSASVVAPSTGGLTPSSRREGALERSGRRALRSARIHASVLPTGMGPKRARRAAARAATVPGEAVAVVGLAGGLEPSLRAGDLVVASEVRGPEGSMACPGAQALAMLLQRRGLRVRVGPVLSSPRLVRGETRAELRAVSHVLVVVRIPKTVVDHRIHHVLMAHTEAAPGA